MSRHRIVRAMNYEDEYYDEDDEYSRSVEDNYCISPGTAAQFTWSRDKEKNMDFANYMGGAPVIDEEGEEEEEDDQGSAHNSLSESASGARLALSETDQVRLNSCLEEIRNIIGEAVSEAVMVDVIIQNQFDLESSLNQLLTQQEAPKPQREPRQRRNQDEHEDFDNNGFRGYSDLEQGFESFQPTGLRMVFDVECDSELGVSPNETDLSALSSGVENISVVEQEKSFETVKDRTEASKLHSSVSISTNSILSQTKKVKSTGVSLADLAAGNKNSQNSPFATKSGHVNSSATNNVPKNSFSSLAELAKQHESNFKSRDISGKPTGALKPLQKEMDKLSNLVAQHSAKNVGKENVLSPSKTTEKSQSNTQSFSKHSVHIQKTSGKGSVSPHSNFSFGSVKQGPNLSTLAKMHSQGDYKTMSGERRENFLQQASNVSAEIPNCLDSKQSCSDKVELKYSGLSLADLAQQHASKGSFSPTVGSGNPSMSLSQLAQLHQSSKSTGSMINSNSPLNIASMRISDVKQSTNTNAKIKHNSSVSSPNGVSLAGLGIQMQSNLRSVKPSNSVDLSSLSQKNKPSDSNIVSKMHTLKLGGKGNNIQIGLGHSPLSLSSCLKTGTGKNAVKSVVNSQATSVPSNLCLEKDVLVSSISSQYNGLISPDVEEIQQADSSLVSEASNLGLVLCSLKRKRVHACTSKECVTRPKYQKLMVLRKLEKHFSNITRVYHTVKKFDFSTPSPDDIVKKKQNQAFTRSNKEFTI